MRSFVIITLVNPVREVEIVNVKPISVLEHYDSVLQEVSIGNPVYLTGGKGSDFAIVSRKELEELHAIKTLFSEIAKGEASARQEGWLSADEVEARLGIGRF